MNSVSIKTLTNLKSNTVQLTLSIELESCIDIHIIIISGKTWSSARWYSEGFIACSNTMPTIGSALYNSEGVDPTSLRAFLQNKDEIKSLLYTYHDYFH